MLDPSTFTYAGVLYTVKRLYVTDLGPFDAVAFETSPALPNDAGLVLRVPTFKTDDVSEACPIVLEYQDFEIHSPDMSNPGLFSWPVSLTSCLTSENWAADLTTTGTVKLIKPPAVTLVLSDASIGENGGVSTVTATVSPASAAAFTVTVAAAAVSPAVAADFRLSANPVLSFAENATTSTGSVTITGVDDDVDAADKTVTVSGTVSATSVTAPATRTLTLEDDDLPTVGISNSRGDEHYVPGVAGVAIGPYVEMSAVSDKIVIVTWTASIESGDTAEEADFVDLSAVTGTVWLVPGWKVHAFNLPPVVFDDALDEEDETFTVTLSAVNAVVGQVNASVHSAGTMTIVDDDPTPTVTVADAAATEGDKVEFVVTLSAVSGRDVTVDYATSVATGDDATSGTDFTAVSSGTLTIAAADNTATGTIEVQTTEDDASESAETFTLTISNPDNATLGAKVAATGTINDDDAAGVTVSATALTVTEQDTTGDSYTVVLDTEPTHEVTVAVGGHAGTDVSLSSSTLTFTPSNWDRAQTVAVTALNDDDTADDAVTLTHAATSTDGNYSGIAIAGVSVTVTDNDTTTPAVTLVLSAASIGENGGVSTVTATVSPASAAAFTVTVAAAAVSPAVAADFRLSANRVLSFAENATTSTGSVTITGVDNDVDAADKTVTVSGTVSAASVTAPATRTLTLEDDDLPVVTIARDKNVVNEDEGDAGFTLTRVGLTAGTLAVTVEVTQQADRDLLPDGAEAMRTVTFAAGSATAALAVALENDNLQEVLGDVTVEVQPGTAYTVGAPASATVTVADTDNTTATPANLVASPGTGPGEVVLSWDTHALHARFVRHQYRYKTDGGYEGWTDIPNSGQHDTPTGEDGSNLTGYTVTGLVGGQAHTFEVRTVGLFSKTSDSSNEYSATPRSAAVSFEAATYSVDEGATVEVTVSLSGAPGREVTVAVTATAAGGATAQGETGADWSGVPENVTFGATDTEQSFTLAATQDMVDDDSEGVVLSFGTLPDGVTAGTLSGATVTIVDDDAAGVTVSATALTVTEQDTTGDSYTVVLDTEPTHEVTVAVGGHAGTDVSLSSSTLTFTPSNWDRAQTVAVTALNDDDTADDAVTLTHTATSTDGNYSGIAIAGVSVTVTDNDTTTPAVTLVLSAASIGENGGVSTVTATVSPASAAAFTVTVAAAAVSPAVAADFRLSANRVLSFAENATTSTGSVTITGVDNDVDAADKTVTVSATVSATSVTAPATRTLTLEDDDAAPTVTVADAAATEGDKVEFVVTLSAVSGRDVTVDYATSVATGDDATSGTDFTAASGTLEIEAGNRTGTIEVQTTEDDASESAETFTLTISNPDNATLGAKVAATGTINDDDANAAPTFSSSATFDAAENQFDAGTVLATDSDTGDDVTGYAITGGADQTFFSSVENGLLLFQDVPNYEDAQDQGSNNTYVVEVTATSGTGTREKTATQTITVTVTDVSGEAPGKPAAPDVAAASVTSLTVSWSAPANAGPAITDYDVQYREGTSGSWTDGNHVGTATTATLSGLSENTSYQVQVRATNDEGTGSWSDSGSGTTDANAAPTFSSSATFSAAENQTTAGTVLATDGDTGDDITGYAITGGADQSFFSIGVTSGALTFDAAPNFEDAQDSDTGNDYVVEVQATSGAGEREKTATQTITVTVTDVSGEAPGKPNAPDVSAASVTSLTVSWSAPANAGPAIDDYDVQYREGTGGSWTDGGHTGTATTATLSSLSENTSYQVQVRATNDEGTGDWSDSGSGTTDANAAPTFSSSATFSAAENQTTAGTVLATDGDTGDDITGYAITGGADQSFFSIGVTSGALTFDDAPNFEDAEDQGTDNTYVVTVQATSGTGTREKTATQTITVTVTDVSGEAPGKPAAPDVSAASVTSLTVSWSAPANAGPAIDDYDVQYREGTGGSWTDGGHTGTATTATLSSLSENTSYQVQVRATNDEGTGDWSDSGSGTTDANAAPAFSSSATFSAAENQTTAGTVLATDGDTGDDVTGYAITGGADQSFFSIGVTSGALTFDAAPNFEDAQDSDTGNDYVVEVQATSGAGEREKTATQTITVTVTDVSGEAPGKPNAPDVSAASVTSLTVSWSAPANAGPAIDDYDVQYREGTGGSWTDGGHTGTATTATLSSLSENTSYQVQVRAKNAEGTGAWSDSGTGATAADANAAPTFSSPATFSAAENQTAAGTVVATDSDADDDITGYAITGGADQSFFSIGVTSGALTFDAAPNFEDAQDSDTGNDYVVEVQATSGAGEREKTATQTITVTVTDVGGEAPGKPNAPSVSAASASSLTVNWSAPSNAGPAITDYDVQYREGTSGGWSDGGHAGTAVTATLAGLSENTSYQVQVRAKNAEGTGAWSDSGTGATAADANAAPTFSSPATFSAAENQTAAGTVVATDSDADDDITGYAITGGADQALFSIGATSGALTFDAAPNYEDAKDQGSNNTYVVEVTATSGTGERVKTTTQTITVTVTDVGGEAPGKPNAPSVSAASASSLTVNWSAPSNAGPAITDYDVRYREGTSGSWSDGGHSGTATSATLTGLSENTSYQVQVRAENDEGTGSWSDSGSGRTDENANEAPTISSLKVKSWPQRDGHEDVYGFGETIVFTLTFSEKVRVKGDPTLEFDLGGEARDARFYGLTDTDFARGSPRPRPRPEGVKVHFGYRVEADDRDDDGVAVGADAIQLGGARIRSAATDLDADLSHSAVGPQSGHKVDGGGDGGGDAGVTIIDSDGKPLAMHENGTQHRLVIREGTTGRYGLKLDTRPTHTVHLRGIQSDGDEDLHVLSNHTVLPIAPDEWETPIWMVILAEQDDDADDGERVFLNVVHSNDPAYNGLNLPDVLVVEDDDDATGSMSVAGDARVRDIGAARLCSALAGGDDANPAAVAAALWEDGDMSEDRLAALDSLGNGNGSYDLGDLLAWMNRCRRGEGPGSASGTEPASPPPALPPSRTERGASRRRRGARGPARSRRKAPETPAAGSRTRRSGWLRTVLLAALVSAWGCGDGIVGPRADAPRHDGVSVAVVDPGPLHVRLTAPAGARDIGAMLVIEGPAIDSVQAPGLEIFETDASSSMRREVVIAGALPPDAAVLRVWVPHRGDQARYRVRLLQVAGDDFSLRDLTAYGTAISR